MEFLLSLFYIVLNYVRPADLFPELLELRIILVVGAICSFVTVVYMVSGSSYWSRVPQTYLMAAFVLLVGLSAGFNNGVDAGINAWSNFGTTGLTFLFIIVSVNSTRRLSILSVVIVGCTLIMACEGIAAYHFDWMTDKFILKQGGVREQYRDESTYYDDSELMWRIKNLGTFADPNDLAQGLLLALPLLLATWRKRSAIRNTILVLLPAGVLLYAVFLTASRGAVMALGVLVFIAIRERWGAFVAGSCAVVIAVGLLGTSITAGREVSVQEESAANRIDAWSLGLELLREHPITGVGFSNFSDQNKDTNLTAHNSYVLCFAEMGTFGYFFWLALIVVTFVQLNSIVRAKREDSEEEIRWARAVRNSLAAYLAGAFFLSRTYSSNLYVLIAMGAALYGLAREKSGVSSPSVWSWTKQTMGVEVASIVAIYAFIIGSHYLRG